MEQKDETAGQPGSRVVWYICPFCHPDYPVSNFPFLKLIDHLIDHLYWEHHKVEGEPMILGSQMWTYVEPQPGSPTGMGELVPPLPDYHPEAPAWRRVLTDNRKILPEARVFLPVVAGWLEHALKSFPGLDSIPAGDVMIADHVVQLARNLQDEFGEQRDYLLKYEQVLKDTAMDPKWPRRPGHQTWFVAKSMAGARWGLTPSTSREFIREEKRSPRPSLWRKFGIGRETLWWEPVRFTRGPTDPDPGSGG